MGVVEQPLLLFLALFALYSPLAAVSSYFPVVARLRPADQGRLALGLFLYVTVFSLTALWVGEPLLELLGVSTAALTATGGIALLYAGVPLMRGVGESAPPPAAVVDPDPDPDPVSVPARAGGGPVDGAAAPGPAATPVAGATPAPVHEEGADDALLEPGAWRRFLFVPITFPLTVGGTTFAFFVGFRAEATSTLEVVGLSVAGVAYAALTGATVYASAHLHRRTSPAAQAFLERIAGILLTAIAVTILASGVTRLVVDVLDGLGR